MKESNKSVGDSEPRGAHWQQAPARKIPQTSHKEMADGDDSLFGSAFEEATAIVASAAAPMYGSRRGNAPPAVEARGATNFVGLSNQGATCYLNAALQSLFMCPEFRARILRLTPDELNLASYEVEEREAREAAEREQAAKAAAAAAGVAHEPVAPKPAAPALDPDAVAELTSGFGFPESMVKKALRKYPLLGQREAAVSALLEGEFSDTEVPDEVEAAPTAVAAASPTEASQSVVPVGGAAPAPPRPKPRRIPIELQRLFARMQLLEASATSTAALTDSFGWGGGAVAVQQDVFELTTQLMDALERSLKSTRCVSVVHCVLGVFD